MSYVTQNLFWGFPTRSNTNQAVQLQEMARGLELQIKKKEGLYYLIYVAKTKAVISCAVTSRAVTAQLI